MTLALFDLDHTLVDGDCSTLWFDYLIEREYLSADVRIKHAEYIELYAAEKMDNAEYLNFHLQLMKHRPVIRWQPLIVDFISSWIVPRISAQAHDRIETHRARGDQLAIITATHNLLSSPIGTLLNVSVIAPKVQIRNGYLTGQIDGPLCFREKKLECLASWIEDEGLSVESIMERYFYTDSINDLCLLKAVSNPVAVNPDIGLSALAQKLGWPILIWRCSLTNRDPAVVPA